jgi:hypothetical protein
MLQRGSLGILLGLLGLVTTGCAAKEPADARQHANVANEISAPAVNAPAGERLLDTTPAAPAAPRVLGITNAAAPITTTRTPRRHKPGADENLPSWVPVRGRLTVVEAPDLAENLGLVPRGTTRSSASRVSVADALAVSPSPTAAPAADAGARSATWLASNGRVRHGRGR